ncbi:MAG: sigma-54 dependent transcriptional regulator [Candidatus Neomarinimicrobiota bacterium]
MKNLLIVDDDYSLRTVLQEALKNSGYNTLGAKDGQAALKVLEAERIDMVISDLMMPNLNGLELLSLVREKYPDIGFLIITAYGTIEKAVEAMKIGAFDFITKPFSISQIESRASRFFEFISLKKENKNLKRQLSYNQKYNKLIGQCPPMQNVFRLIDVVADSDAAVFIQGESGTGKELIAQAIHDNSSRSEKAFIKINCSAIPETLFESSLFGHEKGAFTNAIKMHKGFFEEANGGTLLLDEISEIPITMQAKLLRVLQENTINRVGSSTEIPVDVRVIATSNRKLDQMIHDDKFREDLFFRLNVFPIKLPPLRERSDDIPLLIDHFVKILSKKYGHKVKNVSQDVVQELMLHKWPGNVRELENLVERAILFSGSEETITREHFAFDTDHVKPESVEEAPPPLSSLSAMEKKMIKVALQETKNNRTRAAQILGISVRTLRNKLNLYESSGDKDLQEYY